MSTVKVVNKSPWGVTALWLLLIVAGGALWGHFLAGAETGRAWRALLVSFNFFTSLAGGLVVWPAVVHSANGAWHRGIERIAFSAIGFALPSLLALVILWIGSPHWAPWYLKSFHQGAWLDNSFLFARNLVALLIFWGVAARYLSLLREGRGRITGALLIVVYSFVFSLFGMDLVMSLDPHWYSTLAGAYFFMTGLYIAVLFWALLAAWLPHSRPEQLLDLGRLVVAFSLMASYLMYAHLLLIWYEVLPEEVRFLVPRMNLQPWKTVSLALIGVVYLGPLVLLLTERSKRSRWYLGTICVLVLAGMWVDRWWLVAPTFDARMSFGLVEVSALVALLGFLGLGMSWCRVYLPEVPLEDGERHGK